MSVLALGTVQFGGRYGVANISGQVPQSEVAAILQRARAAGIDTLDTAIAYGCSESSLGEAGVASWRVITKLPALPDGVSDVAKWAEAQVLDSLQRLRTSQLEALLLHKPGDLLGPQGKVFIATLDSLKSRGLIRCAGISIYDPAELARLWPVWRPELVQAPCNVFDRRLLDSGWLATLNRHGVRIHIRSVFLQGVLLMPASRRPAWFARWQNLFDRWLEWCGTHEISPLVAALAFARNLPGVERLVVGVDSAEQLREVIVASAAQVPQQPEDLGCEDRDLIEPSRWKLT
jgi:aryl-alcohol dehydrogenase-like predicted oxidoreductase